VVPAMDLVQVHVIHAQPLQAGIDLLHDGFARQSSLVWAFAPVKVNLGGDDQFVALTEIANRAPDDLFAAAVGVSVRSVQEIDAALDRVANDGTALLLVERPGMRPSFGHSERHASQANAGHLEAGIS